MTSSLDPNIEYNSVNWTPLKQPDNFRIVHLSAGKGDEPLSCVLKEFPIDDLQGSYIAISYTWRTAKLTRTIACNGYNIRITRNLHSALRRIRLSTQYLRIWCDALCIRQGSHEESLSERAQQIPLMGRIFASAARVVVDLGDDDGTLSHALEGINAILATPRDLRLRCHLESNPLEFLKLPEFTHPMWSALRVFLSRPWFQRLWTVQEVTLAREIRVIFGPYAMTFEQLVSVASVHNLLLMAAGRTYQTMTWNVSEWSTPRLATTCLVATFRRRNARIAAGDTYAEGLCDLIMSTLSQLSTDPRDRVYALYGMVDPQLAKELPVSYSENVAQLSQRLSEYFLRTGNGAWMLAHSGGISPDRPSWCINLDGQMRKERFDPLAGMTQPAGDNTLYAAGGTPVAELRAEANNGRVTVRGVVADEIKSMSPPCPLEGELVTGVDADVMFTPFSAISYGLWIYFIVEWARPLLCSNPDALWRTLIANFNPHSDDLYRHSSGHPLPGFRTYFDNLFTWMESMIQGNHQVDPEDLREIVPSNAVKYWIALIGPLLDRRVAHTRAGALALVPESSHTTDVIAVFQGVPIPFVLRKAKEGDGSYRVVGICYVHGLMNGEAFERGLKTEELLLR